MFLLSLSLNKVWVQFESGWNLMVRVSQSCQTSKLPLTCHAVVWNAVVRIQWSCLGQNCSPESRNHHHSNKLKSDLKFLWRSVQRFALSKKWTRPSLNDHVPFKPGGQTSNFIGLQAKRIQLCWKPFKSFRYEPNNIKTVNYFLLVFK